MGALDCPMFYLILRGSPTFLEGMLCYLERVPGSILPALSSCRLLTEKFSTEPLPFSLTGL